MEEPMIRVSRWSARIGCCILCAVALVLSLSDPANLSLMENVWDKLNHAAGYFGLIVLCDVGFRTGRRLGQKGVLVFAYGGLLEVLQYFLPYRQFSFSDMVANLCGILFFFAVYVLVKDTFAYNMLQRSR